MRPGSTMTAGKTVDLSRRRLLRGAGAGTAPPRRPPWAPAETDFTAQCDRCGDCVPACPEGVIRLGSGGFPELDFAVRGCTLCGDCLAVCGGKAMRGDPATDAPWDLVAEIGEGCIAFRGVVCRSCGEACGEGAIRFRLRVGGAAEPRLYADACTGCGCCVGVCPVQAVRVIAGAPTSGPTTQAERQRL
jgi:ferredoxin-type protein NapF